MFVHSHLRQVSENGPFARYWYCETIFSLGRILHCPSLAKLLKYLPVNVPTPQSVYSRKLCKEIRRHCWLGGALTVLFGDTGINR